MATWKRRIILYGATAYIFFLFEFVPFWRLNTQQVLHKEVGTFVLSKGFAHGVVGIGHQDKLEVFVGFDEGVDHLVGRGGIDIVVHFAHEEHEFSLEVLGVLHVGALHVTAIDRVTHPLLVPPNFVHAVVVASTGGIGSLVEVAVEEEGTEGFLSARGISWQRP